MYSVPDWRKIRKPVEPEEAAKEPVTRGIPESPCKTCLRAAGDGCHKPVNPDYQTSCRKWAAWFCETWRIVTGRLRG